MRRLLVSLGLSLGLLVSTIGPAAAVTANIYPFSQSHPHNVASNWTGSWTGGAPYHTDFFYGDGWVTSYTGNLTSLRYSHIFGPCVGEPTTYYQELDVFATWPSGSATWDTSRATEAAGSPC